jgi:hypothetical protein
MPAGFSRFILKHLLALPVGSGVSFEPFADRIIEDAGLIWPIQDQDSARQTLRAIIEHTVVNPMVNFGILQAEYEPHRTLGAEFRQLSTIRATLFGRGLLEAIGETMR